MPLRYTFVPSLNVQQVRSSSLLPFLYHTKTLHSQPVANGPSRSFCCRSSDQRRFSSTPEKQAGEYKSWRSSVNDFQDNFLAPPKPNRSSNSDIPFEDVESQFENQNSRRSTITATEKAIFDRIFKDLDQSSQPPEEEGLEDDQDAEADPYEDLNKIFDTAIRNLRLREEQAAKSAAKHEQRGIRDYERAVDEVYKAAPEVLKASVKRPLRLASGIVLGAEMGSEESEKRVRVACNDHRARVTSMFEQATTDVQVWSILEKEVFSLVKQLEEQIKFEEKDRKAREIEEKRAAKEKKKSKERTTSKKSKTSTKTAVAEETPPGAPPSIALQTSILFCILQNNYADYLLSALRLLRRNHPTSFYAYYLLPTIKRLGPISYVLAASTGLYNEILFLKWTQFSDLHSMADLMQEMIDQGIETNEVTMVFIRRLWQKRRHGLIGRMGPVVQIWWNMRGNIEGWYRVWLIYVEIKKENRRKNEMDAIMEGKEYEEDGEVEE